jgi:hypothetical protein
MATERPPHTSMVVTDSSWFLSASLRNPKHYFHSTWRVVSIGWWVRDSEWHGVYAVNPNSHGGAVEIPNRFTIPAQRARARKIGVRLRTFSYPLRLQPPYRFIEGTAEILGPHVFRAKVKGGGNHLTRTHARSGRRGPARWGF